MLKKLLCAVGLSVLCLSPSFADEPIGGSYFTSSGVSSGYTIISSATNTNGLHIKTVVVACSQNVWFNAVPPGSGVASRLILACNPQSNAQGIASLPYPLYLPPGYAFTFSTGSSSSNQVYVTYDLNNGP
jgi:hypothetical protein